MTGWLQQPEGCLTYRRRTPGKAENDKQKRPQTNALGGGGSSNDIAQGYHSLPALPTQAETPELPTVTGFTKDGCIPRVDEAQGVVIVQTRTQTSQGGVVTGQGACSDSELRFLIQKSYASCTDRIDMPGPKLCAGSQILRQTTRVARRS